MNQDRSSDDMTLVDEKSVSSGDDLADGKTDRWDLFLFTVPFFGLQLAWTIQQVFGVPYLSSLGITETHLPVFVLAGPLAGFLIPPFFAAFSERCQSSLGKRKPFIFLGGLGSILSFLLLAAAQPLAVFLTRSTLKVASTSMIMTASHSIAGIGIYGLNFSLQPLQLGLRASVVDHFSPHEQPTANLWISCFQALGSVFVALVSVSSSPAFWDLTAVVTCILTLVLVTVAMTKTTGVDPQWQEQRQVSVGNQSSLYSSITQLIRKVRHLPPVASRVCRVQLVSWFSWFLVLNYTSALISGTYDGQYAAASQDSASSAALGGPSNTVSRWALLFHLASFITLIIVFVLWPRFQNVNDYAELQEGSDTDNDDSENDVEVYQSAGLGHIQDFLMRRIWRPSLAALAALLIATCSLAVTTRLFSGAANAMLLVLGANGVLFALANWVPYTLIAQEASAQAQMKAIRKAEGETVHDEDDTPGLLAVHNLSITLPQIAASLATWLLMQALSAMGIQHSVVWIFALCIPPALWAACL